ncbi:MAG: enoyl-CoA hydratase-related protein [Chloroflexi bacterium]|nr:enoyl-CoA hydratase-related protein [Chloroflexota bacterium]
MTIRYDKQGHIATITLNRPESLNAANSQMRSELVSAWLDFRDDPEVWVAIVTGAGERAFCAGADVKEFGALSLEDYKEQFWRVDSAAMVHAAGLGLNIWKPVVGAINGHCLGFGLTLASACDIRIASPTAAFGFPEVRVGLPTIVGAVALPRLVALGAAAQLLLTGESIDAEEAFRLGLVNKVVPQAELLDAARTTAERLCSVGPLAVRVTKEVMLRGLTLPFVDAVRLGESFRRIAFDTEDAQEGPRAFVEKRKPRYKGR